MSRDSFELSPIDYEDPRILEPRTLTSDDAQRCGELQVGIRICRLLLRRWLSLFELGRELGGLSERTVRRYIYALQGAGFDIVERQPKASGTKVYRLEARSWHGMLYMPEE